MKVYYVKDRMYIDGVLYGLVSIPLHKTKTSAEERAKRYRQRGISARIIKIAPAKYAVYAKVQRR